MKGILRRLALSPNPYVAPIYSAGKLFGMSNRDKERGVAPMR